MDVTSFAPRARRHALQVLCAVCGSVSTLLGPTGPLKAAEDASEPRLFRDTGTVLQTLDVQNPFVSVLRDLAHAQNLEHGSGATTLIVLVGALCHEAAKLEFDKGIPPDVVARAFLRAGDACLETALDLSIAVPLQAESKSGASSFRAAQEAVQGCIWRHVVPQLPGVTNGPFCPSEQKDPLRVLSTLQKIGSGLHHGRPQMMAVALDAARFLIRSQGKKLLAATNGHNHNDGSGQMTGLVMDISNVSVQRFHDRCVSQHVVVPGIAYRVQRMSRIESVRQAMQARSGAQHNVQTNSICCVGLRCATIDGSVSVDDVFRYVSVRAQVYMCLRVYLFGRVGVLAFSGASKSSADLRGCLDDVDLLATAGPVEHHCVSCYRAHAT